VHLRLMRLSEKGLLRWYAGCCDTPLFNTMATPKVPFVGVLTDRLDDTRRSVRSWPKALLKAMMASRAMSTAAASRRLRAPHWAHASQAAGRTTRSSTRPPDSQWRGGDRRNR
jgi:hypothetical protein